MGRYSLWVQVPLQLLVVVLIIGSTALLASIALHDAGLPAQIAGGLAIGTAAQLGARYLVLRPWHEYVDMQRTLIHIRRAAEKAAYEQQPYD